MLATEIFTAQTNNYQIAEQQQNLKKYQLFLEETSTNISIKTISKEVLQHHRISISQNQNLLEGRIIKFTDSYFGVKSHQFSGLEYVYDVILGIFKLNIYVLNLQRNSDENDQEIERQKVGSGGFGYVRVVKIQDKEYAVKRINFRSKLSENGFDLEVGKAENLQIKRAIRQYCVYKICSMLEIGPKIIFRNTYDLVCFQNCIQFYMELCDIPSKNINLCQSKGIDPSRYATDLKKNLKVLHSINFIHKDIKPQNILYSPSKQKFIFADFGMAHTVKESWQQKTLTGFEGTFMFSSEEMKKLHLNSKKDYVNLYFNDLFALEMVIECFKSDFIRSATSLSKNSMSFNQSYNGIQSYNEESYLPSIGQNCESQQAEIQEVSTPTNRSSPPTYSTTNTIAPFQYSSLINFFQAEVIYDLCRSAQINYYFELSQKIIEDVIEKKCSTINLNLKKMILQDICSIFYPNLQDDNESYFRLIQFKNSVRNIGPQNEETKQNLNKLITYLKSKEKNGECSYYNQIYKILQDKVFNNFLAIKNDIRIHKLLRNHRQYFNLMMACWRQALVDKKNEQKDSENEDQTQNQIQRNCFLLRQTLTIDRFTLTGSQTFYLIYKLLLKYFSKQELIKNISIEIQQMEDKIKQKNSPNIYGSVQMVVRICQFSLKYLQRYNKCDFIDLFSYMKICPQNKLEEAESKIRSLESKIDDLELSLRVKQLWFQFYRSKNQYKEANDIIVHAQQIVEQNEQLKNSWIGFTIYDSLIMSNVDLKNYETALSTSFELVQKKKEFFVSIDEFSPFLSTSYKFIGTIYLSMNKFEQGVAYLQKSLSILWKTSGFQNNIRLKYEIISNLMIGYRQLRRYEDALNQLQLFRKIGTNSISSNIYHRIRFCDWYLHLKLEFNDIRLDPQTNRDEIIDSIVKELVYLRVKAYYLLFPNKSQTSKLDAHCYIFKDHVNAKQEYLLYVKKRLIRQYQEHLDVCLQLYKELTLEVANYYFMTLKLFNRSLHFYWKYLEAIRVNCELREEEYKKMNFFVSNLMKSNSYRRALIFLKRYIFRIPSTMIEVRKKAFNLGFTINKELDNQEAAIYRQIIKDDYQMLESKDFTPIYHTELRVPGNKERNKMLEKWLYRI